MERLLKMCVIGASTVFYHKRVLVHKNLLAFTKQKQKSNQSKRKMLVNELAYIRNFLRCENGDIIEKMRQKEFIRFVRLRSHLEIKAQNMMISNKQWKLLKIKQKVKEKSNKMKSIYS